MMKKLLLSKSLFSIIHLQKELNVTSKLFCFVLLFLANFGFGQIAQRGTFTRAETTTNTLTISKPTGVVEGDVMIVNIAEAVSGETYVPDLQGWTNISSVYFQNNARVGAVLYKVAGASEPTSYTFTLWNVQGAIGSIVAFSGVDTADPFDASFTGINARTDDNVRATSITTTTNNAAVIMLGQVVGSARTYSGWRADSPNSLTQLYDVNKNSGSRVSVGAAWAIKPTPGVTGTGSATLSNDEYNGGILIALKPKVDYKSQIISADLGSSTWCAGETRTVSVVIKNVGKLAWTDGGGKNFNIGIKWNGESTTIWNDYHVRVDAQNLAPGETKTYYFNITASRRTVTAYGAKLGTGSNNITFDVVSEGISWFKDNNGGIGPGNKAFVSPTQTIVTSPDDRTVSAVNSTICIGTGTNITVASSQSGVSYQLRNGTTNVGSAVNGTGGNINLPTGPLSTTTTFNVLATLTSSSCPLQMTNTPTVTVNSLSGTPVDTYTFCIDNTNTITTANVNSGQYVLLNVIKGYKYTFSVNNVFAADEYLSLYNASNDAVITSSNGTGGTSITDWIPTFSGQVKILLTAGANCANAGTAGGSLSLNLTGGSNTLETQNEYGTNTWTGHIYNAGGIAPEPFSSNYAGYYNVGSETINEGFGGNENCFAIYSDGVKRASIYTEGFAVRYKMKTTKSGCYIIRVTGDDGVRLSMNNTKIFDRWGEQGSTTYNDILVRLDGDDDFVLDYYENAGGNVVGFTMIAFDANTNNITSPSIVNFCPNEDPDTIEGSLQYTLADVNLQNPQLNFQWQLSTNGGTYSNIPGATARTYHPPAIQNTTTASIVRHFKRLVSFSSSMPNINNVKTNCGYNESNIITITTNPAPPIPTVGTITHVTCTSPKGSVVLSGLPSGAWTITQSSTTGNIDIPGTGTSYPVSNLLAGIYKFTVNNGSCTSVQTGNVVINDAPSTTYNGTWSNGLPDATKNVTFASAFPITADLSACACTINSGVTMTVPSGRTLNITNALTVLGTGSLSFDNNASLVQGAGTTVNSNS
ncbi:PA14 domain-containing protein, partial [Flavobacterium sp. C3NV]|uniref:PA14 domain-containing protein n=1 Tax=Flavobacterium sp. C3NV TaxID=3393358 RepID=UPI00398FDB6D